MKKISVVVSVYNEELSLNKFYQVTEKILESCAWDYEMIFVNDGSVDRSIEILKELYPDAKCSLDFNTPFEMLVAVCLSAQCTDERVNKTTPSIFAKYNTPQDFANADIHELEELVHPCGFYKNKAKNLVLAEKVPML